MTEPLPPRARSVSVPRPIRFAVYGWLLVFLGVGFADVELWPLTGWRLFSASRTAIQRGYEIVAVDAKGAESRISFSSMPQGYRRPDHILKTFHRISERERDDVCRAWADAAAARGREVTEVRIYAVTSRLHLGSQRPAERTGRELRWECAGPA